MSVEKTDFTPNETNLKRELEKRGFKCELAKGFVVVKYTDKARSKGYVLNGLQMLFDRKLVDTANTEKGFYLAFSA